MNTLRHIARLTDGAKVRMAVGGLHLERASARRMDETVRVLSECASRQDGFCHCTGLAAIRRLWDEFPEACVQAQAGMRIEL